MPDGFAKKIGKYPIQKALGHGATGAVYLAFDRFNQRQVAIKVMSSDPAIAEEARQQAQRAFLNEAALAGRLDHPHIATIYDAVSEASESYIVMEYVDGGTLARHCRPDNLLPVQRVVELMFMACLALDHAHQQGVIHCDIKPANLLLTEDGQLKIGDFGAAQYNAASHTILSGVGSPMYMSPEQVTDQRLNHQTDIYSLGAVFYELLTGKTPSRGSSRESLLYQIAHIEPPPPSELRRSVSPELDRIVLRMLAKDRDTRYARWREIASDIEAVFSHLELPEQDQSDAERFSALRQLHVFRGFSDAELWEALRIGIWHRKREGTVLLRELEPAAGFFIVVAGSVVVSAGGRALETLGEGHFFGDILYFETERSRRATSVTSATPVVLVEMRAEALQRASAACQVQFNQAMLRIMVNRVERLLRTQDR